MDGFELSQEAALLEDVRSDSAQRRARAYDTLFVSLRDPVLRLCASLSATKADAEDATQDVFLAVHRALPTFRGESRLSTWVFRIAIRAALERRARARRHDTEAVNEEVSDPRPDLESSTHARREAARVMAGLEKLSFEHRTVLSLFALRGLSHKQIAEILGIKEGTVWSRLHLARKHLAQLLEAP